MVLPFRKLVGGVTALMVLFCGIYCACGSTATDAHEPHEAVAAATSTPHCHVQDGTDEPKADAGHSDSQPCHHHDHDTSCKNCQPTLSVDGNGKTLTDLTPNGWLFGSLALIPTIQPLDSPLLVRSAFYGDLPPPTPAPTLLSLHCALTT